MTEDEARTKWCPFARVRVGSTDGGVGGLNRQTNSRPMASANCIASECMAWRWWINPVHAKEPPEMDPDGYCGLSGLPGN